MTFALWDIEGKTIGDKPYLIAEIGLNHNGDEALAAAMIEAAHEAGADAVKFQIFKAENLVSRPHCGSKDDPVAFFQQFELGQASYRRLFSLCRERGITFLATPFDFESVDFLAELGVGAIKIASGDLTHLPLLRYAAKLGKPMLISTGMATIDEISVAVVTIRREGNEKILLLHCTSAYPCPASEVNLNSLLTLQRTFNLPLGFSDHTQGLLAPLAAVLLGATLIEKHFTLDKNLPGPDQALSMEPAELAALVADLDQLALMWGSAEKQPTPSEMAILDLARRGVYAAADIPQGTVISAQMLTFLRPASNINPNKVDEIIGKTATQNIAKCDPISHDMFK